jgi:iron complex outermembrane receptor protein
VTGGGIQPLDGRPIPGIPAHWVRLLARAQPAAARGAWIELEQAASSGYLVDDTMDVRTSGWTVTHVRIGWDGTRLRPFVGVQNLFDRRYVGSVVINAARGRYFEPAPGRNAYLGLSVGMPR